MLYAIAFFSFAAAMTYTAISRGGLWLILLWPATSFLIVSLGYAVLGPRVMGKGPDGRFAWWSRILLLPFRLFVYGGWSLGLLMTRESPCDQIAPNLWVGRRVRASELPAGTKLVVDLTSEM